MVELQPVDAAAFAELCDNLRPADERELVAAYGRAPRDVIAEGIVASDGALAARDRAGRLVAIFGCAPVGPLLTPMASPWLLGTPRLRENAGGLVKLSRQYVAAWLERYPVLVNFVDARNTASIRYLRLVGFAIDEAVPYGAGGMPFHRFHLGFN